MNFHIVEILPGYCISALICDICFMIVQYSLIVLMFIGAINLSLYDKFVFEIISSVV